VLNYNKSGASQQAPVTIPSPTASTGGTPNAIVVNSTSDFGGNTLLISTEDGIIASWKSGTAAAVAVDNSGAKTVYKGLAMAVNGGKNYLYATDFHNRKIDVFDKNFAPAGITLSDGSIPSNYSPFGIANIGGNLYVSYARQKVGMHDDSAAVGSETGIGYVDIYNPNGTLIKRFASQGTLNSPWGIVMSNSGFGDFKNSILVSNFGDGAINAYDSTGTFLGQLKDKSGNVVKVEGLWGIAFAPNGAGQGVDPNFLFFAAGPNEEGHGAFGYVQMK